MKAKDQETLRMQIDSKSGQTDEEMARLALRLQPPDAASRPANQFGQKHLWLGNCQLAIRVV